MTSITAPTLTDDERATIIADLTDAGLSPEEIDNALTWKPFCPFDGCVCEKYADCYYCTACTGAEDKWQEEMAAMVAEDMEMAKPFWEFLYGPDED